MIPARQPALRIDTACRGLRRGKAQLGPVPRHPGANASGRKQAARRFSLSATRRGRRAVRPLPEAFHAACRVRAVVLISRWWATGRGAVCGSTRLMARREAEAMRRTVSEAVTPDAADQLIHPGDSHRGNRLQHCLAKAKYRRRQQQFAVGHRGMSLVALIRPDFCHGRGFKARASSSATKLAQKMEVAASIS